MIKKEFPMSKRITDIIANGLANQYQDLSVEEGRIIAHAYTIRNGKSVALPGSTRTPPDGYLDATCGQGFLDAPQSIVSCWQRLVSEGYLQEHVSEAGMVRISDRMIPVCEKIINGL